MRWTITFASLLLAVSAFSDPVITSITPNVGAVAGGTKVIIKGSGFSDNCIICSPPLSVAPEVFFYETRAASVKFIDSTTLEVIAPAHPPAKVSIRVRQLDGSNPVTIANAFEFMGDPNDAFDPILFPIFTAPVRGAFDSEFHTRARLWNESEFETAMLYGRDTACYLFNPHLDGLIPLELQPGGIDQVMLPDCSTSIGRVFWVAKDKDTIAANLRVTDVTRQATSHGVEIPVVHKNDFTNGRVSLLGVPIDAKFRNTLRIYSLVRGRQDVIVQIGNQTRQLTLQPAADVFQPAYAQFSDCPLPADMPPGQQTVRVVVDAIPPCPICPLPHVLPPVWAFITVTNNETQQITTITPN
jgi:hypothetical protein